MYVKAAGRVGRELTEGVKELVRPVRVGEVGGGEEAPEEGVKTDELMQGRKHPFHMKEGFAAPNFQLPQIAAGGKILTNEIEVIVLVGEAVRQHQVDGFQPGVFVDVDG